MAELIVEVIGPGANLRVKGEVHLAKHADGLTYSVTASGQPSFTLDKAGAIQAVVETLTT